MAIYYAKPNGSGSGSSSSPFKISDFWGVAAPGDTLNLLGVNPATDGLYQGINNMIQPPSVSGTAAAPITIQAVNDGGVLIDGQFTNRPVWLVGSSYLILQGFNAANSSFDVIATSNTTPSNNITFRRICAWNALDSGAGSTTNNHVWALNHTDDSVVEDCAGFGRGRYIFITYGGFGGGNRNILRRCFARWDGYDALTGPHAAYQLSYDSHGTMAENCLASWSGYLQTGGSSGLENVAELWGFGGGQNSDTTVKVMGSIAYMKSGAVVKHDQPFIGQEAAVNNWLWQDVVAFVDSSLQSL